MAAIELRLQAFVKLGSFLADFVRSSRDNSDDSGISDFEAIEAVIAQASIENGWFTRDNILYAFEGWSQLLEENSLRSWISNYKNTDVVARKIAIISAGNIPMVGFHDLLATVITGHRALVKCASNDKRLLPFMADFLGKAEPTLKDSINFTDGQMKDFDAVIATGSNNTARYFEYYFGKKPNIIRKNRNSVAVLSGNESADELKCLGEDIFRYYGLGCRSVSKVFVPDSYDFDPLFKAIYSFSTVLEQQKYLNNYEYNKAVYLMSNFNILDNGFFMLKEDPGYASPIATLFYEHYSDKQILEDKLASDREMIQCIVSSDFTDDEVAFGQTQRPGLDDYADGIDTVEFLLRT